MLLLLRYPSAFLGMAIALVVAVVAHALAQVLTARAFGDRLPVASGRLTADPRRHLDPFGVIVMVISGIGWGKPVPIQEPRFRGGRTRYVLAILAGPLVNLVLGVLGLVGLALIGQGVLHDVSPALLDVSPVREPIEFTFAGTLLYQFAVVNAAIGILTLLPIPPLDGARILWLYAPKTPGWRSARYRLEEQNIGIGIVVLLSLPLFGGRGLLMSIVLGVTGAFFAPIAEALGFSIGF